MQLEKKDIFEIFENALRFFVIMGMLVYGGAKIVQFDGASETKKTVCKMTGMELMWAFYGYSKPFAINLSILNSLR